MPRYPKLSHEELDKALATLPEWRLIEGKLHREYQFPSFSYAFGFMAAAAPEIEKMDHHPEWRNVYNRVTVDLITHDSQGITAADVKLAGLLESIAQRLK